MRRITETETVVREQQVIFLDPSHLSSRLPFPDHSHPDGRSGRRGLPAHSPIDDGVGDTPGLFVYRHIDIGQNSLHLASFRVHPKTDKGLRQ